MVLFTTTTGAGAAYWIGILGGSGWSVAGDATVGFGVTPTFADVVLVVTRLASTHTIWANGVKLTSGTSAIANGSGGSTLLSFGSRSDYPFYIGLLYGFRGYEFVWSDAQIKALGSNAWQLFA